MRPIAHSVQSSTARLLSLPLPAVLLALGAIILGIQPALWLFATWNDPVWNSGGWMMALVAAGLLVWSLSSRRVVTKGIENRPRHLAWCLLGASALVRLASQVLGINFIGAFTLAIDVYAVALLLGTDARERPVSAFWLSALFVLALPLERVIQRIVGFGLQQVSATGACGLLHGIGLEPVCNGIAIELQGQNVLVDVPCSGARGLLTVISLYLIACAIRRPNTGRVITGLVITLCSALVANTIRISLLAAGIAMPHLVGGVNVMDAPWHEATGVVTLLIGALPVVVWARFAGRSDSDLKLLSKGSRNTRRSGAGIGLIPAAAFCLTAVVTVSLPATPVDVSRAVASATLPRILGGHTVSDLPLSAAERAYFTQYGGEAKRGRYGDRILLTVSTTSPLRHLHSPDECLRASGHKVRYLGLVDGPLPGGIYRSTDPAGNVWRISVSFVSSRGQVVTNVSHAVWLWMRNPGMQWTMVQRIRPWTESPQRTFVERISDQSFDQAIAAMLDARQARSPDVIKRLSI